MSAAVSLRAVALAPESPTLTLSVKGGETVAIVGPAASGKTRLLRIVAGIDAPPAGEANLSVRAAFASADFPRKATPQTLAKIGSEGGQATRTTEALGALHLWEVRKSPLSELSPSQLTACELIAALAGTAGLIAIDCQLDSLDAICLRDVMDLLRRRRAENKVALAIATCRPDIAIQSDLLVALRAGKPHAAGKTKQQLAPSIEEFEIVSQRQPGVRALVAPFEVDVSQEESGVKLRAKTGQKLAARLLSEGFGDVKFVVRRQKSIEERFCDLI